MLVYVLLTVCAAAFAYQLTAILACLRFFLRREAASRFTPPVSILKPVCGLDADFAEAIRSHATQDYPEFEILFAAADPDDPALAEIEHLRSTFPGCRIRVVPPGAKVPNRKAGALTGLSSAASHPVLLVNDSDICVPPGYLRDVVAPLEDERTGIVTCLYRASADTLPGIFEALGIASDFAPGVLVAPLVGVREFGLGSTLVFRRRDLERIGGFAAIAEFLADDYQLAKRITSLGLRAHLSRTVVTTQLHAASWGQSWRRQVRWHRTIRLSRGAYIGLPVTHATCWAAVAAAAGLWWVAAALFSTRMAMALVAGVAVLRCPIAARWFWLIPLRDLWGCAVWIAGLFGNTVEWRGRRLRLSRDGRILE